MLEPSSKESSNDTSQLGTIAKSRISSPRRHGPKRDGSVRRGEVWWGAPSIPGEARKRRPFLVVSDDAFNRNDSYEKVLVVHLTTARRGGGPYSWEVEIPRGG